MTATALAQRAADVLARAGYTDLSILNGGVTGWEKAGFELFSGVNVPSKAFGEHVEHDSGTPSISASELDALINSNADIVVVDSRPFDEYQRVSIPTSTNVPGAELAAAHSRHRAEARDAGGGELRRPHPQHHRRAIADQRRNSEQGRGVAKRHDGLQPRWISNGQRQGQARPHLIRAGA